MRKTLHVLGVPHTIPHEDYTVCAFTAKILYFPEVIQPFGWRVVEYSNEGSASAAQEHVVVLDRDRFRALSKRTSRDEPHDADVNNAPLRDEFHTALLERLRARAQPGDIVCHVWGPDMDVYNLLPNCHHVELSVGYTASPGLPFRIYETSAWMHWHHGRAGREDGSHYQWVIPSKLDAARWPLYEQPDDYAVFFGRITARKGMNELVEIARRLPDLQIHAYGPGDSSAWATNAPPNLHFEGTVFEERRLSIMQRARCMLMPTVFIEPFGNSGVEAQLCGVPLIGSSYGSFTEIITDGVTGYRCHTLADWVQAVKLSDGLDRRRISAMAHARYGKDSIGAQFDWVLQQLADLSESGWYGVTSRKFGTATARPAVAPARRVIWLYIPYFGSLPNYFQLYLDSLAVNADVLSIIMPTDCDLSGFRLPDNLKPVHMTFQEVKRRAAALLRREFDTAITPEMILQNVYKLCDFKILYPEMFFDIGERCGIGADDFVGWGDCDLIYGRISDFFDTSDDYHAIGGYNAHLTAMRNTVAFRRLFRTVSNLIPQLREPEYKVVDETAFREALFHHLADRKLETFEIHRHFCDIIPPCFFHLFRADHAQRAKNFFDAYNCQKDIDIVRRGEDGRLTVVYDDGTSRPAIYCHLQKRALALHVSPDAGAYDIHESAFEPPR